MQIDTFELTNHIQTRLMLGMPCIGYFTQAQNMLETQQKQQQACECLKFYTNVRHIFLVNSLLQSFGFMPCRIIHDFTTRCFHFSSENPLFSFAQLFGRYWLCCCYCAMWMLFFSLVCAKLFRYLYPLSCSGQRSMCILCSLR